jgi:hypothetical protein
MRWSLDSISELAMPLIGVWGPSNLEFVAYDPRVTVTLLLVIFFLLKSKVKLSKTKRVQSSHDGTQVATKVLNGLIVFQLSAVVLWSYLLFYARYAMPLEIVLGLALLILINKLNLRGSNTLTVHLGIFLITLVSIVPNWNTYQSDLKEQQLQSSYIGDSRWQIGKNELMGKNQTFVFIGMHLSYLIRSADPSNSFLRIEFYGKSTKLPSRYKSKLNQAPLFLLTNENPNLEQNILRHKEILYSHNLLLNPATCSEYSSISEKYWICPITKITT